MSNQEIIPKRFQPSKFTLFVDRFMTQFIKVGGLIVITAVLGIFLFILIQIIPLFQGAKVKEVQSVQLPKAIYTELGVDEGTKLPFLLRADGKLEFVDLANNGNTQEVDLVQLDDNALAQLTTPAATAPAATPDSSSATAKPPAAPSNSPQASGPPPTISAVAYSSEKQELIVGLSDGLFSVVPINYTVDYNGGQPKTSQALKPGSFMLLDKPNVAISAIDFGDSGDAQLVAGIQQVGDQAELHAVRLTRQSSLLGSGDLAIDKRYDLTPLLKGKPVKILVSSTADSVIVLTAQGDVEYFFSTGDQFELRQQFQPFKDLKDPTVASMNFLFGDVSLVFTNVDGTNRVFSLLHPKGSDVREFVQTKQFPALPGVATFYSASLRNKAFLTGCGQTASLRYSTTEAIRWQDKVPFQIQNGVIGPKYNSLLLLDADAKLHVYNLVDPHPEMGFTALFGKVWYEGYPAPSYEWQSTGGSDEFEPKFSLVPLVIGTLKGTLYAMIFAIPISLLAAVYTSQYLHPNFKVFIKPTMEIMASLPSVVLGFLAALWLAPILEQRVPSLLTMVVVTPLAMMAIGYGLSSLPVRYRNIIRPGYEIFVAFPLLVLLMYISWNLGPTVEKYLFVVTNPETGHKVADFRLWWPLVTGASYDQRNSLVVGLMMGFAVIPIIFTITEDALTNVPESLRSGSLALGASRWQTTLRIILPTASAGIFSAIMIGLGRAVGETMIVVMATGNTPIMDWNIFSGMRTLSANIAVELPEAPYHGTLYRTLFLGAMFLFLLTFLVNTVAEVLRQHLREKYRTV